MNHLLQLRTEVNARNAIMRMLILLAISTRLRSGDCFPTGKSASEGRRGPQVRLRPTRPLRAH